MGKTAFCGSFIPHRSNNLCRISCSSDLRLRLTLPKFRHHNSRNKLSMWLNTPKETLTASDDIEIRTFYPRVDRIIAIGDVHGDASALRSCLSIAGLVTSTGEWAGGDTHLVQVAAAAASRIHMLHPRLTSGQHDAFNTQPARPRQCSPAHWWAQSSIPHILHDQRSRPDAAARAAWRACISILRQPGLRRRPRSAEHRTPADPSHGRSNPTDARPGSGRSRAHGGR